MNPISRTIFGLDNVTSRKVNLIGIQLAILSFVFSFLAVGEPVKRSLIIAVGDYDRDKTGWTKINSANDIPLVKSMLLKQGFGEENMVLLKDEEATKSRIEQAFQTLLSHTKNGDMVWLHYSGHGQQISDNDNDEIDGLDESLIAFDAPVSNKFFSGEYRGELHLRDDELGQWTAAIRKKIGKSGHLVVVLDACHSGTGTRGSAMIRGGSEPFIFEKPAEPNLSETESALGFGDDMDSSLEMGKIIIFSGAKSHEVNYETYDDDGLPVGSLTYSMAKSLDKIDKGNNYRQLFSFIRSEMALKVPHQQPSAEGDLDYEIFGGNIIQQEEFLPIAVVINDHNLILNAGKIAGIFEGSKVELHPAGNLQRTNKPVSTGKITMSKSYRSQIELDEALEIETKEDYKVFISEQSFGDLQFTIQLDKLTDDHRARIEESLKPLSNISIFDDSKADLKLLGRGSKIMLYNNSFGNLLMTTATFETDKLINFIRNYLRGQHLKQLDMNSKNYHLELELIPVRASAKGGRVEILEELDPSSNQENGYPFFSPQVQALIKVTNKGDKDAYFNIIDIQPDGVVNPIIPRVGELDGSEYKIAPGKEFIFYDRFLEFGPPYGNETFKIIASPYPLNLTTTLKSGSSTRGKMNKIEELFGTDRGVNQRGAVTVEENTESDVGTYEYSFILRPN